MPKVKHFILTNVTSVDLRIFLEELYTSISINEQLLGMCLLIELKYGLVDEKTLTDWLDQITVAGNPINFDSFTKNRQAIFTKEYFGPKISYSRVVDKRTFDVYIGSYKYKRPYIEAVKIAANGWSTRNGVVWVTPKSEIERIWSIAKLQRASADMICDHLGFPRDMPNQLFYRIDYSPNFPDRVFQPNSSNRLWHYPYNLFLSITSTDCFGLTYNENMIAPAREQVHDKSHYLDAQFSVEYIGGSTMKMPINQNIIEAAKLRLNL